MSHKPKVNLNSINELKIASDDALPYFFESLGFTQSNVLTDVRLALGLSACVIAGVTFYFDYTMGFEDTKKYTVYAVIAYFVLNTVLTWWMWWVEGGKIYVGKRNDEKIVIESYVEKYKPVYQIKVTTTSNGNTKTVEAKNSFSGWFDEEGYLVPKPFQAFLRNNVPLIAAKKPADKKPTVSESGKKGK